MPIFFIFLIFTGCSSSSFRKPAQIDAYRTSNQEEWPMDPYNLSNATLRMVLNNDLVIPQGDTSTAYFTFQNGQMKLCPTSGCSDISTANGPYCEMGILGSRRRSNGDSFRLQKKSILTFTSLRDSYSKSNIGPDTYHFSMQPQITNGREIKPFITCYSDKPGTLTDTISLREFKEIFGGNATVLMNFSGNSGVEDFDPSTSAR